jgi:hypothetical protein
MPPGPFASEINGQFPPNTGIDSIKGPSYSVVRHFGTSGKTETFSFLVGRHCQQLDQA